MDRLLVGVDGSPCSMHALRWAADLAGRAGLEVMVAGVYETRGGSGVETEELREHQLSEVREWCSALPPKCERRQAILLEGEPPQALLEAVACHGADLLVVGSRGRGGFGHLHIGSVAHDLLHLTHVSTAPLAVVPPTAPLTVNHLVVGNDGSPGSEAAVNFAAAFASALGVPVTAVFSVDPARERDWSSSPGGWRVRAEQEVRGWATPIEKAGVSVDVYVDSDRQVHPVAAIEYALQADSGSVAILGTRGLGGFSGLHLGRVPLQLVQHTGNAVVLVPPQGGR